MHKKKQTAKSASGLDGKLIRPGQNVRQCDRICRNTVTDLQDLVMQISVLDSPGLFKQQCVICEVDSEQLVRVPAQVETEVLGREEERGIARFPGFNILQKQKVLRVRTCMFQNALHGISNAKRC